MLISNENLRKFSLYVKGTKKNAKDLVVFFKGPVKEILVIRLMNFTVFLLNTSEFLQLKKIY